MKNLLMASVLFLPSISFGADTCEGYWSISKNVECRHPGNGLEKVEPYSDEDCAFKTAEVTEPSAQECGETTTRECVEYGTKMVVITCLMYTDDPGYPDGCLEPGEFEMVEYCKRRDDVTRPNTCTFTKTLTERVECKNRDIYYSNYNRECPGSVDTFTTARGLERPKEVVKTENGATYKTEVITLLGTNASCSTCESSPTLSDQVACIAANNSVIDDNIFPYSSFNNVKSIVRSIIEIQQNQSGELRDEEAQTLEDFLNKHWL